MANNKIEWKCCGKIFKSIEEFKKHVYAIHRPASEIKELNEIKYGAREDI